MSEGLTIKEESQRLMDIISDIEEKLGLHKEEYGESEVALTETEKISLERAKLRLSAIERAEKEIVQRNINDSIEKGEGLFPKEMYREIKKEE